MQNNIKIKGHSERDKNFLFYVPHIIHDNYKVNEENIVTLYFYHNKFIERVARWLVKKSNISDIEFDARCSTAWLLIDGKRNVYEIAMEMSAIYGDTKEDAIERLVFFIKYILKRKWIKFLEVKPLYLD